jgi:phi13 family phage major tail protein
MPNEYGEFVGVDSLHYAEVLRDDENAYIADTPQFLAPSAEIAGGATINSQPTYYDNLPSDVYINEGVTVLTLTIKGIPADKAAYLLGKEYDAASGRVYDTGKPKPPLIALGFRFEKGPDEDYRHYWYLKGRCTGGNEEATSRGDNVTLKTYQLTFTAITTKHKWTVNGKIKPLKRIFADTTDEAFDPEGWFEEVQTPDTVSAPPDISLTSIVPDDDASNVAVNTAIKLTFNNKIARESVSIISATGVIVAVTKSWNATGKELTLTPNSSLSSSTTYIVAINGVVDVYGQELAATAKNFATSS